MGDKPGGTPNPNTCTLDFWKGGMQPSFVLLFFHGIKVNPIWEGGVPPPPEGWFKADFIRCNEYYDGVGLYEWWCTFYADKVRVTIFAEGTSECFAGNGPLSDPSHILNENELPAAQYYDGYCDVWAFTSGFTPLDSWLFSGVIGVPNLEGYFAEQGYSGLDANHYRYANHRDGTNIKLIMED